MRGIIALSLLFFPVVALAAYDTSHLPYSDAPRDRVTAVAVSFLTQEGVLQGYPDGTFKPDQPVNRAEFMKVAMRVFAGDAYTGSPCLRAPFPDVHPNAWYAPAVCLALDVGVVGGYADGLFHPERTVNYVEALKILVLGSSLTPEKQEGGWYAPYLAFADQEGIGLPVVLEATLTRAQVAELVASFLAYSRGELSALRAAQEGKAASSASSFSCRPTICPDGTSQPSCTADGHPIMYFADPCLTHQVRSSSSSFSSSVSSPSSVASAKEDGSSQSSGSSFVTDPGPDFSQLPGFLRLGMTSSILGAAKIFNDTEPFTVDEIAVNFTGNIASIDQVRLYATADRRYLGGAARDTSNPNTFVLSIANGILSVPKRQQVSVYARIITSPFDRGGVSGEDVRISSFTIKGRGDWSTRRYTQSTTEAYGTYQTARSTFTAVANAGPAEDILVGGTSRTLGKWRWTGVLGDGRADLKITDLTFQAGTSGGVTLSNVQLKVEGSSDRSSCSVSGSSVTCSSISESIGTVGNGERTLILTGDIAIPASSQSAGLQMALAPAGTATSAGAVQWTDGTTSFSWVPFEEAQLRSTYYRQ